MTFCFNLDKKHDLAKDKNNIVTSFAAGSNFNLLTLLYLYPTWNIVVRKEREEVRE